jgi:replicative DNA helicase
LLPFDTNSEAGIVGTLLYKPSFIIHSENLKPNFFYTKEYASIYWAIMELYKKGIDKIDEFNIITQLNSNKATSSVLGKDKDKYIIELMDKLQFVKRDTVEEYLHLCNIVISMSFKREVYKNIKDFESRALDVNDLDLNKLNYDLVNNIDNLAIKYTNKEEVPLFSDKLDDILQEIEEGRNENGSYGIPSVFKELNNYFSYEKGELLLYMARRKHGKSVIGMNELVHKLKMGLPCVYFDTEMQDKLFTTRLLSHLSQVEEQKIKNGIMTDEERKSMRDATLFLKNKAVFSHIYDPSWTREKLYTHAKILKHKINFQFMIHDYLKITDNMMTSSSEQYNELGNWTNFLKNDIAGGLDVPVLSMVQLNRNGDISDSDKIERYATAGIKWTPKTPEELINDGKEYGNYKMEVMFNRIGGEIKDDEYLNYWFDKPKLTIHQCENIIRESPSFMKKGES